MVPVEKNTYPSFREPLKRGRMGLLTESQRITKPANETMIISERQRKKS